jgi:hypothetical protein
MQAQALSMAPVHADTTERRSLQAGAPLFTIVCVSHRPEVLESWLLPSTRSQTASYELRVVNQRTADYPSCAAALNAAAVEARGRYLMFVHHDVAWDSPDFLAHLAALLDRTPRLGVAGVVGSADRRTFPYRTYENAVLEGDPPGRLSGRPLDRPRSVQTVDELMVIVPTAVFRRLQFDPIACDDWHLYGVDYSLSVRRLGLRAWVLPVVVRHKSSGVLSPGYYRSLARVCRKHRGAVNRICTTCGTWDTRTPPGLQPWMNQARLATTKLRAWAGAAVRSTFEPLVPHSVRQWMRRVWHG